MKVRLSTSRRKAGHFRTVSSFSEASRTVRDFIERYDLTAGCGSDEAFVGGEVYDGNELLARVSYNGRVWNINGEEIV